MSLSLTGSTGSITRAVEKARAVCGFSQRIDVEVQSYEEAKEAILAGADVVMLDNMTGRTLIDNAKRLKQELHVAQGAGSDRAAKEFLIESSGGIDVSNVGEGGHVDDGAYCLAGHNCF